MTLALSSRTTLRMSLAIAALTIVGTAALSTPASAAKQKDVLAACSRTKGCGYIDNGNGTGYGCSPHACFECANGKCHQTRLTGTGRSTYKPGARDTIGKVLSTNSTKANDAIVHRGNTTPVKFAAPGNNHMRMGGRH